MAGRVAGKRMYLWRAVDDEGEVLDRLVQRRRDTAATLNLKLMRKPLRKQGFAQTVVTTNKLRSYGAAFIQMSLAARQELLARLRFRRLSVRPQHPESDPAAQEAFRGASPSW